MLPGAVSPTAPLLRALLRPPAGGTPGVARFLAPLATGRPALARALHARRPFLPASAPVSDRPRALGAALETALALLRAHADAVDDAAAAARNGIGGKGIGTSPFACGAAWAQVVRSGHVIVFTSGAPTVGPGGARRGRDGDDAAAHDASNGGDVAAADAEAYWAEIGAAAASAGIVLDVLAGGAVAAGLHRLLAATRACGGCASLCDGFSAASGGAGDALRFALLQQRFAPSAAAAGVDVRLTPGVTVARIVGPVGPLPAGATVASLDKLAASLGGGPPPADTSAAVRILSPESTTSVSYAFALAEDSPARWVHAQWVCRSLASVDDAGTLRVITRRVRCTPDAAAYAASLAPRLAAVLAAKVAAADALGEGGAASGWAAAEGCGARLAHAASACGAPRPGSISSSARRGGKAATPLPLLPRQLASFGEALYHLQRGPLLRAAAGAHADETAAAAAALLTAPPAAAAALVQPALYRLRMGNTASAAADDAAAVADAASSSSHDGAAATAALIACGVLVPMPPVDMALQSEGVLLLDAGARVTLWLGAAIAASQALSASASSLGLAAAAALSAGRFPPPAVRCVREGSSGARHVSGRLAPLQGDAPEVQRARLPSLRALGEPGRAALAAKLLPTDAPSFSAWLAALGYAAPPEEGGEGGGEGGAEGGAAGGADGAGSGVQGVPPPPALRPPPAAAPRVSAPAAQPPRTPERV
jgi:hypothetical protein